MNIVLGLLLLSLSALFSGLTIGLMSLDLATLRRKASQGNIDALKVLKIREKGMLLLVTLLLGNAAANSFFAIVLGDTFTGLVAGIASTSLIFLFGEVLPQAVLSRHALTFGAYSAPLIRVLMIVCYPICAPVASILVWLLGEEVSHVYTKKDILSIVEDGHTSAEEIDSDEKRIMKGSLSYSHKKAQDVMTPNTVVTTVELDDIIDETFLKNLKEIDYSRIPVQTDDPNQIVGILYYKDLVGVKLPVRVKDVMDKVVQFVNASDSLDVVLNQFIKSKIHLFVVIDDFGGFEGVITLEDIIEEIIGAEIMDEGDDVPDLREVARQKKELMKKLSKESSIILENT